MKGCFRCFNLRTDGLILSAMAIFGGFVILLLSLLSFINVFCIIPSVIIIAAGAFCFYGIKKNRYSYMLPYLVLSWMDFIALVIILIYIPIDWYGAGNFKKFFESAMNRIFKNQTDDGAVRIKVLWIFVAMSTVARLYYTIMMQILYKSIKTAEREKLPTYQQKSRL